MEFYDFVIFDLGNYTVRTPDLPDNVQFLTGINGVYKELSRWGRMGYHIAGIDHGLIFMERKEKR